MEILLDPTCDSLANTQWAVQTLTWSYIARFPSARPLRALDAANITYMAIIEHVQASKAWAPPELRDLQLAINHWVMHTSTAILQGQAAIRGICRFCGCCTRYRCPITAAREASQLCSWSDAACTVCTSPACQRHVTYGTPEFSKTLPAVVTFPPTPGTEHGNACGRDLCRSIESQVVRP